MTPFVNLALVPEAASSLLFLRGSGTSRYAMFGAGDASCMQRPPGLRLANAVLHRGFTCQGSGGCRSSDQTPAALSVTRPLDAADGTDRCSNHRRAGFLERFKTPRRRAIVRAFLPSSARRIFSKMAQDESPGSCTGAPTAMADLVFLYLCQTPC